MDKKCYIVGAGENSGTKFIKGEKEYVIAADGGLKTLNKIGVIPDMIIGDFDSLGYIPEGSNVIQYKVEKDDTDMMLAVKYAIDKGFTDIIIYGGTGGRIDHTIANIQTMIYASNCGAKIKMIDSQNVFYLLTNGEMIIDGAKGKDLSVFAVWGRAKNVTIKGGKYQAQGIHLTEDNPTAVSNSFLDKPITVKVENGSVLIIKQI